MSEEQAEYKTTCKSCGTTEFVANGLCLKCRATPQNNRGYLYVGIDPDTKKSGYAEYCTKQGKLVTVNSYSFFEIFDILECSREIIKLVRIEAGWINAKANFHGKYGQSKQAGERIAKNVGSNHETGRKLAEMCEYLNIPYELVKPLGTKAIDAPLFKKITGWTETTNQDNRDAAMLVFKYK